MTARRCRRSGLPRTRGDGPGAPAVDAEVQLAPPHTRGWTRELVLDLDDHLGSPAHAGMDPGRRGRAGRGRRLPRTRGDGPVLARTVVTDAAAPPHTRGWTLLEPVVVGAGVGSPAHAGMDPPRACPSWRRRRLPRTRGDGPDTASGSINGDEGSPAHAGMDPRGNGSTGSSARLPRTRGDGPRRHA